MTGGMTMAGIHVVERRTRSGDQRFHVRMSASRYDPITHLGVYDSRQEAELAQSRALLMLSEGVVPTRETLQRHRVSIRRVTVKDAAAAYLASRVDIKPRSVYTYKVLAKHCVDAFGDRDVRSLTVNDVQAWINSLVAADHKPHPIEPRSAPRYVQMLRIILAHAGVDPNPARTARGGERGVRVPYSETRDFRLPTRAELDRMYDIMTRRHAMAMLLLEHTGLRVGEAAALLWSDRDTKKRTLHVRRAKTKAGRRFVADLDTYPSELVELLDQPTRTSSLILGGLTGGAIASAMRGACTRAGFRHYSPHDLRHLHASRLLANGWDPASVQARLGHANAAITLGIYTHVVPPD